MENFKWGGYQEAMELRGEVLEVCMQNGWKFVCMQPGKRFVILAGNFKYYWTYGEVLEKGSELNGKGNNKTDKNRLLASEFGNKVSLVRSSRNV